MEVFAFLRKSPIADKVDCGEYNGYVGIINDTLPDTFMSSGTIEEHHLDAIIGVHGGITFDNKNRRNEIIWDKEPIIPLTAIPDKWYQYRVIGFDCAHFGDTKEMWTFEAVKKETKDMMEQVLKLLKERSK